MARNKNISRERQERQAAQPATKPAFWKRPWIWLAGALTALALLLSNLTSILSNARELPEEWGKTSGQFWDWYGEYDAWKGEWTTSPEGIVDGGDLQLSKIGFRLQIDETGGGSIVGSIETPGICQKIPYFEMLMVEGTIDNASRAEAKLWDIVGGHRREFARVLLERNDDVMIVKPLADPAGVIPASTRIARDPGNAFGEQEAGGLCPDKRMKFVEDALKGANAANGSPSANPPAAAGVSRPKGP